eukprot:COSAG01_NODE_1344_length_10638_cov_4.525856_8_plen_63_part_00
MQASAVQLSPVPMRQIPTGLLEPSCNCRPDVRRTCTSTSTAVTVQLSVGRHYYLLSDSTVQL